MMMLPQTSMAWSWFILVVSVACFAAMVVWIVYAQFGVIFRLRLLTVCLAALFLLSAFSNAQTRAMPYEDMQRRITVNEGRVDLQQQQIDRMSEHLNTYQVAIEGRLSRLEATSETNNTLLKGIFVAIALMVLETVFRLAGRRAQKLPARDEP